MQALTDGELLTVWEVGRHSGATRRALVLLAAAYPDVDVAELARLPIGRRDALLLDLRQATFGRSVEAMVRCPGCAQTLEAECTTDELRAAEPRVEEPGVVIVGAERVAYRLPDSLDLLEAGGAATLDAARRVICERCLEPREDGAAWSEEMITAVAAAMAADDPQAAQTLTLDCPDCGANITTPWDVTTYFWSELDAWAVRVLEEVHVLASAYGWTEDVILALTLARRRMYLDLVNG